MCDLKENERLDDLQVGNLRLIQNSTEYCFTSDAVLLANFVKVKKTDIVADFCTGSGIIAILVAFKKKPKFVIGVELQQHLAEMARRSVQLNGLCDVVEIENISVQEFAEKRKVESLDAVICNPPYIKQNGGGTQTKESLKICRHEVSVTLEEICEAAGRLLKFGGKFFMVHKSERCADIFLAMQKNFIVPKEITMVCAHAGESPNLVLICGVKKGNSGLKWNTPLVMYDENGNFTKSIKTIYSEENDG